MTPKIIFHENGKVTYHAEWPECPEKFNCDSDGCWNIGYKGSMCLCAKENYDRKRYAFNIRDRILSLHKGDSEDLVDKGWNAAIEEVSKLF